MISLLLIMMLQMKKPIYIKAYSLVCNTSGEMANPNKKVLIMIEECMVAPVDVRVKVIKTPKYLLDLNIIEVVAEGESSDGTKYYGWTDISSLKNGP